MAAEEPAKWWSTPRILMAVAVVCSVVAAVIRFVQGDVQTAGGALAVAFVFGMCMGGGQQRAPKSEH